MYTFEHVTSQDKKRLFGNSRILLEEEKFRKSALPRLEKLERKLQADILKWEEKQKKPFLHHGHPYLAAMVHSPFFLLSFLKKGDAVADLTLKNTKKGE